MGSVGKQCVIAVCGQKNSGKTTLIERMIRGLSERGLKTAVIKHDGHEFTCDIPGTDSDRYMAAGAAGAAVYSSSQMFVRRTISGTEREDAGSRQDFGMRLLKYFPDADVVIIEGMKNSTVRKIEVVRRGIGTAPVSEPEGRILIVTDLPKESFQEPAAGFDEMDRILGTVLGMNKDVCAVILAGGKSSRMGRDKATLTLGHETFLQRIAAELDACGFQEKYVSLGSGSRYRMHEEESGTGTGEKTEILIPGGWSVLRDRYRDCGPLGGIHAALSACRAEWALFVSCDTPLYRRELAELLISKVPGLPEVSGISKIPGLSEVSGMSKIPPSETDSEKGEPSAGPQLVVPVTPDGRWHMTCALWRRTLLPEVEAQLKSGDYRLRKLCLKDGGPSPGTVLVHLEGEQAAFAEMLNNINTEEDYRQMVVKNCRGS